MNQPSCTQQNLPRSISHLEEAEVGEEGPEEGHQDRRHRKQEQDKKVAPLVLLLFGLAGPPGQPQRYSHHEHLIVKAIGTFPSAATIVTVTYARCRQRWTSGSSTISFLAVPFRGPRVRATTGNNTMFESVDQARAV